MAFGALAWPLVRFAARRDLRAKHARLSSLAFVLDSAIGNCPDSIGVFRHLVQSGPGFRMTFPRFFWTYVCLCIWGIGEYLAWTPYLDLHRKLRHRFILLYILFFVLSAFAAIHEL
jgi:hypothetical protein